MSSLNLQWASRKTYWRNLPNIAAWTTGYQSVWFKRSPQFFPTGLGSCFLDASSCKSLISWSFEMISSCCNLRDGLICGWTACLGPWVVYIYDMLPYIYICYYLWLLRFKFLSLRGTGGAKALMKSQAFWINTSSHKWDSMSNFCGKRHCAAWCKNIQHLHVQGQFRSKSLNSFLKSSSSRSLSASFSCINMATYQIAYNWNLPNLTWFFEVCDKELAIGIN